MAKGRVVDDTTKLLIANVYREHPDWRAKEIQAEVNKRLGQDWPGLSVVQKELSKIRENLKVDNPQDKPWGMATLDTYPIPPETLPIVLKAYKHHIEMGTDFTIRQAKWVSRLSATEYSEALPDLVAKTEQLYEIIGRPFDSTVFDKLLIGLKAEAPDLIPVFATASLAGILKDDPTRKEGKP